jgi:hypothetical protein
MPEVAILQQRVVRQSALRHRHLQLRPDQRDAGIPGKFPHRVNGGINIGRAGFGHPPPGPASHRLGQGQAVICSDPGHVLARRSGNQDATGGDGTEFRFTEPSIKVHDRLDPGGFTRSQQVPGLRLHCSASAHHRSGLVAPLPGDLQFIGNGEANGGAFTLELDHLSGLDPDGEYEQRGDNMVQAAGHGRLHREDA